MDLGGAYVFQLPIRKWRFPRDCESLARLNLVKQDIYWFLGVIRHLHCVLILHQVSRPYLDVPNVEPVHKIDGQLVGISHHHMFLSLNPLVVNGCDRNFI